MKPTFFRLMTLIALAAPISAHADNIGDDNPLVRWKCTQGPCWGGGDSKPHVRTKSVMEGKKAAQAILDAAIAHPDPNPNTNQWAKYLRAKLYRIPFASENASTPECADRQTPAYFALQKLVDNQGRTRKYLPESFIHVCPSGFNLSPEEFGQMVIFQLVRYFGIENECKASQKTVRIVRRSGHPVNTNGYATSCPLALLDPTEVRDRSWLNPANTDKDLYSASTSSAAMTTHSLSPIAR